MFEYVVFHVVGVWNLFGAMDWMHVSNIMDYVTGMINLKKYNYTPCEQSY